MSAYESQENFELTKKYIYIKCRLVFKRKCYITSQLYEEQFGEELSQNSKIEEPEDYENEQKYDIDMEKKMIGTLSCKSYKFML